MLTLCLQFEQHGSSAATAASAFDVSIDDVFKDSTAYTSEWNPATLFDADGFVEIWTRWYPPTSTATLDR